MKAVKVKQIRDTTYIKSDSVFIEKKITEKVTPSWCYIAIIIALLLIIGQYLYGKLRIKKLRRIK